MIDNLVNSGVITDRSSQIKGIDEEEIILANTPMSDNLRDSVESFSMDFEIKIEAEDINPFKPVGSAPSLERVGEIPSTDAVRLDAEEKRQIANYQTFSEEEILEAEENSENNLNNSNNNENLSTMNKDQKNFSEEAEETNLAAETAENVQDVVAEVTEESPLLGSEAMDDENLDIQAFSEEEIASAEEFISADQLQDAIEDLEEIIEDLKAESSVDVFNQKLKSAKSRIKVFSKKLKKTKGRSVRSFSEELTEAETEAISEDIVSLMEEVPAIKEAVLAEVSLETEPAAAEAVEETTGAFSEEVTETDGEAVVEQVAEVSEADDELLDDAEGEVSAFTDEEIESAENMVEEDAEGEVSSFTSEEIEVAENMIEEVAEDLEERVLEPVDETPAPEGFEKESVDTFRKVFSNVADRSEVGSFKAQALANLAQKNKNRIL